MSNIFNIKKGGEKIANYIADLLKEYIEDPRSDRRNKGSNWIYSDNPRLDITGYPRIGVEYKKSTPEYLDIGHNWEQRRYSFSIVLAVKKETKFIVSNDDKKQEMTEQEWASFTVEKIFALFKYKEQDFFKDNLYFILDTEIKRDVGAGYRYYIDVDVYAQYKLGEGFDFDKLKKVN